MMKYLMMNGQKLVFVLFVNLLYTYKYFVMEFNSEINTIKE